MRKFLLFPVLILLSLTCGESEPMEPDPEEEMEEPRTFYKGADLSYVNEMLDCGATYLDKEGNQANPYTIFSSAGCDIVRVRLWHSPDWTDYSNYNDVRSTISMAKSRGMKVLLDFHYSDDWADPGKQYVPAAWLDVVDNTLVLGDSIYNYTYKILEDLSRDGLHPEYVQTGNEINAEILQVEGRTYSSINWTRNALLLKRAMKAVRDVSDALEKDIDLMLHIAQPENALWWFEQADANGVRDYDWIGISYYPNWSDIPLGGVSNVVQTLVNTYDKRLMVVEAAYPYTLDNVDAANNILGQNALVSGYPATEQGQYDFLRALDQEIFEGGGEGLIYWEPAWLSTDCSTRWGQGSHWDNATMFAPDGRPLKSLDYFLN